MIRRLLRLSNLLSGSKILNSTPFGMIRKVIPMILWWSHVLFCLLESLPLGSLGIWLLPQLIGQGKCWSSYVNIYIMQTKCLATYYRSKFSKNLQHLDKWRMLLLILVGNMDGLSSHVVSICWAPWFPSALSVVSHSEDVAILYVLEYFSSIGVLISDMVNICPLF